LKLSWVEEVIPLASSGCLSASPASSELSFVNTFAWPLSHDIREIRVSDIIIIDAEGSFCIGLDSRADWEWSVVGDVACED
jgi:hypothetical protein